VPETKICSKCKQPKPLYDFYKLPQSKDGYSYTCYDCRHKRYLENKDKIRAYQKTRMGKACRTANNNNQRAKFLGIPDRITSRDWLRILEKANGQCYHCKRIAGEDNLTLDHLYPLFKGGTNTPDNIVASCAPCNHSKGAKLPHNWEPSH